MTGTTNHDQKTTQLLHIVEESRPQEFPKEKIKLTSREAEIATMVAHGKSYKYISHACSINEDTVKFHVEGLRKKLCAENKTHAIALALVAGLIHLEPANKFNNQKNKDQQ